MDHMDLVEEIEEGATLKAVKAFSKILAVLIVLSVAAFGDVAYIQQMSKIFTDNGLLLLLCYIGAFTSFMSVAYLLLGKTAVFAPGAQMLAAWIVFGVELVIIALNIILVFNAKPTGPLAAWAFISPATPVFHMIGVALILFLSPELKEKHRDMEMKSKIRQSKRAYRIALEDARMRVQTKHLEFTVRELENAINSAESQKRISDHAQNMNDRLLTEMSGRNQPKNDDDDDNDNDNYYNANRFGRK
jgi:hypothetical protein